MDEAVVPKSTDTIPPSLNRPPKHRMPRWLKILVWAVVVGVSAVCIYVAVAVVLVVGSLSHIANKCTVSQNQATAASNQYAAELNTLGPIFTQPYGKASASPSGDCIDTSSHSADATLVKMYSTPEPIVLLSGSINSGLESNGFKQTLGLTLKPIDQPTDPIYIYAVYSKPGFPDLTVSYDVGRNPDVCSQVSDSDYNSCVSQYEASFNDINAQNVSEVDLDMTKDFPNNY